MKKIFVCIVLVTVLLQAQAQFNERSSSSDAENAIKLNISSLMFAHFAFQYERVIGNHITACLGVRYRPNMTMGGLNNATNTTDPNGNVLLLNPKYSSLAITPEFRYYTKEAMRGFYIAPYIRYRNTPIDFDFEYIDDNNQKQTDVISGKLNAFMGGAMIGTNIFLTEKMNLDLFIIGGHFGRNTFGMDWTSKTPLTAQDQADLNESFREISEQMRGVNFDYTVDASGIDLIGKFTALGFRGVGLNLVYKF